MLYEPSEANAAFAQSAKRVRSARRGIKKDKALFFPPLVAFRASRKMPLSPSLAHKAGDPVKYLFGEVNIA